MVVVCQLWVHMMAIFIKQWRIQETFSAKFDKGVKIQNLS